MTIAIGMLCDAGLFVAADTKMSNLSSGASCDVVKVQDAKSDFARYVAAYASEKATAGESLLHTILSDLMTKNLKSLSQIKSVVENTMAKWSKAFPLEGDRPETELVLGAFFERAEPNQCDEIGLFWCNPPKTVLQKTPQNSKGYIACGNGAAITDPLFRILFGDLVSPHNCLCQISYLMARAKIDYAVYCGGETDVMFLGPETKEPLWIERIDMAAAEVLSSRLDMALSKTGSSVFSTQTWDDPNELIGLASDIANLSLAFQRRKFRVRDSTKVF